MICFNEYKHFYGLVCPRCQGEDLHHGQLEVDGNEVYQPVNCNLCEFQWADAYTRDRVLTWDGDGNLQYLPEVVFYG